MTYHRVIFCFVFLLTAAFTMAQDNLSTEKVRELTELHQSIRGTYQIQMKVARLQPAIPLTLAQEIEDARTDLDTTYIDYCKGYRVMVLPRSIILAKDFLPVEQISGMYRE